MHPGTSICGAHLDDPGHRRIHGVAVQSVLVTLLVLAANVRKIRPLIAAAPAGASGRRKRPRRFVDTPWWVVVGY